MLRLTVAPCPSDCDSESSFFTTARGFSNGAAAEDEAAGDEAEDMMAGRSKKTDVTTRIRRRIIRRSCLVLALLLKLVFLQEGAVREMRRLVLSLVRRASAA
jgi:hypothetical protein